MGQISSDAKTVEVKKASLPHFDAVLPHQLYLVDGGHRPVTIDMVSQGTIYPTYPRRLGYIVPGETHINGVS